MCLKGVADNGGEIQKVSGKIPNKACLPFSLCARCHIQDQASFFMAQYKLVPRDLGQAWFLWAYPVQTCKVCPHHSTPNQHTQTHAHKHIHKPSQPIPYIISSIKRKHFIFNSKTALYAADSFVMFGLWAPTLVTCSWCVWLFPIINRVTRVTLLERVCIVRCIIKIIKGM